MRQLFLGACIAVLAIVATACASPAPANQAAPVATPSAAPAPSQPVASTAPAASGDGGASVGAPLPLKRSEPITIPQYSGKAAPNLKMTMFDGSAFNLDSLRGKPAVLNFWASWCGPCREEMPALERSYQKYKDPIAFVGVAVQDTEKDARDVASKRGITYPVGLDADNQIGFTYQIAAMPTTIIIDANGIILKRFAGATTEGALNFFIDTLVKRNP